MYEKEIRKELVERAVELKKAGFFPGFSGNISCRLGAKKILMTPAGADKGRLKPADLSTLTPEGLLLSGRPFSSEYEMHLLVYSLRPDAGAVVHTHPPFISAYACSKRGLQTPLLAEFFIVLGGLPKASYETPGGSALAGTLKKMIMKTNCILLENHGLVCAGRTLAEAAAFSEEAEHYAKVSFINGFLGPKKIIPSGKIPDLKRIGKKLGFLPF